MRLGRALLYVAFAAVISCGGRPADFGTLPEVSVPIEKQPEQDPTLFRDEEAQPPSPRNEDPPDPKPLRSRAHFDFVVEFNKGTVKVASVRQVTSKNPQSTPRRMGRFAFELWTGVELVERVRFDFPLLGASTERGEDPLGKGLSTQTTVRVPAASRAQRARILDRKTREEVDVSWPPALGEEAEVTE